MKKTLLRLLLYAASGALCALPMLNERLGLFGWCGMAPVLLCELCLLLNKDKEPECSKKRHPYGGAYLRALVFFYAYGLVTFYWFVELYPLDYAGMTPGEALGIITVAWLGLPLLQAAVAAVQLVLLWLLLVRLPDRQKLMLLPFVSASLWIIFEWIQTQTWAGVPWGKLAMGQAGSPEMIQSAALFGSYFVAFIMITVNALTAIAVYFCKHERLHPKRIVAFMTAALLIFTANMLYGLICVSSERGEEHGEGVTVAAVQGNISSSEKWSEDSDIIVFSSYEKLTADAAASGAQLIIWSETAIPYEIASSDSMSSYIGDIAKSANAQLIVGAFDRTKDKKLRNVLYHIDENGNYSSTVYAKRHLVPFGEYVPWRAFFSVVFPPLSEIGMLAEDLEPGYDSAVFETKYGLVGSLICFDSIYETLARDSVNDGAQLIIVSTNDSWFSDSSALYQHNRHAVLRAVENGRYIVRAANTGISTIITPKGTVKKQLDPLVAGYTEDEVYMISEKTLYTTVGNIIVPAGAIFCAAVGIEAFRRKRRLRLTEKLPPD